MRPYLALLSARYRMALQYRAAAIAGAGTQLFWGFIRIMIFGAFHATGGPSPMSLDAIVSYVWLGQAFLAMQPWNHDRELGELIRGGNVAYELVRPIDLYSFWYARTLAMRMAATSLRCVPLLVFAGFVVPLTPMHPWALSAPASLGSGAAFLAALLAALLLGCAITTLIHISLLWTISGDGMTRLIPALVVVFSGMVIPLPLFPDWAQPVLTLLPFRGLADAPYRLYSGDLPVSAAPETLLLSLGWTVALVGLGRWLLARGTRRLVVQGG